MAHMWADWLHHPCRLGGSQRFTAGNVAHKWVDWLHDPCHPWGPLCFKAADEIKSGPDGWATSPLPFGASPTLQRWGQNHKGPKCGQIGYATIAVHGVRNTPNRGSTIKTDAQWVGLATSPLPSTGSRKLHCRGPNHKWPKNGWIGYIASTVQRVPITSDGVPKSEVAHICAHCLHHPCRVGGLKATQRWTRLEVPHM